MAPLGDGLAESSAERGNDIVVVGAGLVGSILAVILRKEGFKVTVYERYANTEEIPALSRSINLVMTRRGLKAAELLGLKEDLVNLAVQVNGRVMHMADGSETWQKYGRESDCNYSVSRYQLNLFLIRKAREAGCELHFDHALQKCEFREDGTTVLHFKVHGEDKTVELLRT